MVGSLLKGALLSLLVPVILPGQQASPATQPFALSVAPPRIIVPYTPGQTVVRDIEVTNTGSTPVHVDGLLSEFTQQRDGSVHFTTASADSGVTWVTITPNHLDIGPQLSQRVQISVAVPENADQGERQIGLSLRVPAPSGGAGNIHVTGAIGVEILVGAPGPIVEKTHLATLSAPGLSFGGTVHMTLTVAEQGNVHREFVAPHQLYADIGGTKVSFPDFLVLRGVTRTISTSYQPPLFCVCKATVTTDDGQGHLISVSKSFVVFPLTPVAGVVILALGLWLILRALRGRRRGRHQAEVDAARQEAYELARRELLGAGTDPHAGGEQPRAGPP